MDTAHKHRRDGCMSKSKLIGIVVACIVVIVVVTMVAKHSSPEGPRQPRNGAVTGDPMVDAGGIHTVGLKSNGTVIAEGHDYHGQGSVGNWTGIIQVTEGGYQMAMLKSAGGVVADNHQRMSPDHRDG